MFKWYGILGLVMVVFAQLNFFFRVEPFATWYFPLIWFGYIFVLDALVYHLRKHSLITNNFYKFVGLVFVSSFFWWVFEFVNSAVGNWNYIGAAFPSVLVKNVFGLLAFSTVLPAFFETVELIRSFHLFDKVKLKKSFDITKRFLYTTIGLGVASFILPILLPTIAYPLVWLSFFLILDPINYMNKQPSIIQHLKDRKLAIPLSLLLAGIIMGLLWEFWNNWAVIKWTYDIPLVGFFKVFEMPVLGYLGYLPFAFELYAMYYFVRSLFLKKEPLLSS